MSNFINYPLTLNSIGSSFIITNSTINSLISTNISSSNLNITNITSNALNITNFTMNSGNIQTFISTIITNNTAQGINLWGANISPSSYDTQLQSAPNLYNIFAGDLSLSSYYGTSINLNMGTGGAPLNNNSRIPNSISFSVNLRNNNSVGNILTVKNNGNVGVYTTNPSFNLDINGTLRAVGETDLYGSLLYVRNSNATQNFTIQGLGTGFGFALGSQSNDFLNIIVNNTSCMYISTGNVQILNGSQVASLTLSDGNKGIRYSGSNVNGTYFSNNYPTDGIVVYGYPDGALGTTNGGNKIQLFWNRFQQVGINNTNPSYSLDISGTCRATAFQTTSGSVSLNSSSFSTVYSISSGTRGYITIVANAGGNACMVCGFFEWTSGITDSSVYPIAWNINNVATGSGNTSGGISITMGSSTTIQAKFTTSVTANYNITLF